MLEAHVLELSNSPWSTPMAIVKKKDGLIRISSDYRKLNQITKKDVYPLPRCDEILKAMAGAAIITHFDPMKGCWQIPIRSRSHEKTAFSTPEGPFQFKWTPFGLFRALTTFQRVMNSVLNGLNWKDCLVYLDDVIIFAPRLEE